MARGQLRDLRVGSIAATYSVVGGTVPELEAAAIARAEDLRGDVEDLRYVLHLDVTAEDVATTGDGVETVLAWRADVTVRFDRA